MLNQFVFHLVALNIFVFVSCYKLKSFNLNKYSSSSSSYEFDCVHTTRANISIPKSFTFCYRHKPVGTHDITWSNIFLGDLKEDWSEVEKGLDFAIWPSGPWVGAVDNGTTVWVAMGKGNGFELLAWRHTCLSISFVDGRLILYENGKLQYEDTFDEYIQFKMPSSVKMISVGCAYGIYKESNVGVVTDFQLFSRILSKQEMENWTGCKKRLYGDLVSWDLENWFLNQTGDVSGVEYLDFEEDVCNMQDKSNHIFPLKTSFPKSLKLCEKVSGKLFQ